MICIRCGRARLAKRRARVRGEVKDEAFAVRLPALVCPHCRFTTVEGKDMPEYMRLVADAYRRKHDLLTRVENHCADAWLG
jgi:hypothetical protein